MQILLRADSTTNGSGSIKTRITMLERIRTSRCIIHALYAYNSYIRALTYRKQRRQLYSIYRSRVLRIGRDNADISVTEFPNSTCSSFPDRANRRALEFRVTLLYGY